MPSAMHADVIRCSGGRVKDRGKVERGPVVCCGREGRDFYVEVEWGGGGGGQQHVTCYMNEYVRIVMKLVNMGERKLGSKITSSHKLFLPNKCYSVNSYYNLLI